MSKAIASLEKQELETPSVERYGMLRWKAPSHGEIPSDYHLPMANDRYQSTVSYKLQLINGYIINNL